MTVRPERAGDIPAIHRLNEAAFGQPGEADLVDRLRRDARPFLSLVAEIDGEVAGHIAFSPVTIEGKAGVSCAGLGPMAVSPALQQRGVGSMLVLAGLDSCRRAGFDAVVLVGHPAYYPRFGFRPGSHYGLRCEYEVPDDVFMALELRPGALSSASGLVRYHEAFRRI